MEKNAASWHRYGVLENDISGSSLLVSFTLWWKWGKGYGGGAFTFGLVKFL